MERVGTSSAALRAVTGVARFITSGMSDELIEAIGPLPRTHARRSSP